MATYRARARAAGGSSIIQQAAAAGLGSCRPRGHPAAIAIDAPAAGDPGQRSAYPGAAERAGAGRRRRALARPGGRVRRDHRDR
eukprot:SAG31_NODE_135_length_23206_cov_25.707967_8_plen_84_part_00